MNEQSILSTTRLGFIGAGNMAQALIGGLLKKGLPANNIVVSDPIVESLDAVTALGVNIATDNQALLEAVDTVVFAIKPQVMVDVVKSLSNHFKQHKLLVISIAAGITCDSIEQWSETELSLVRCMPNTPALVQAGASALYANQYVSSQQKKLAQTVLEAVGIALWVDCEEALDAVTAVSGSGPAYFFLLMESMQKTGEKMGLTPEVAKALTLQTALGAATMACQSDVNPAELRQRVTSPNGTTQAAIESLLGDGFEATVDKALKAAHRRSEELAKELG